MKYINQNSKEFGVTVRYATLGEYFKAIYQSNLVWEPRGSQDFLPYSTGEDVHLKHNVRCYLLYMFSSGPPPPEPQQAWTGFYASRNVLKGVARQASSQLYAAETLFARYQVSFPDGPVAKEWALDKLKALRWAVSEVVSHNLLAFKLKIKLNAQQKVMCL